MRTGRRFVRRGTRPFTTSGDPRRSVCTQSVVVWARGCTCARTRSFFERVDENGVPVSADEPAERTLATGLANRTFPFIRYDLGDQVEWLSGPCACGGKFARLAEIGGRRDDDFRYGTTTVPASAFRHMLGTEPRVSEYQVTQTVAGAEILTVGHARHRVR